MAHYVMSDIHGETDRFHAMLEKTWFSADDALYILGDVIDRGTEGISLLLEIMEISPDATGIEIRRWNKNGNAPTLAAYLHQQAKVQQSILDYLSARPSHLRCKWSELLFGS